MSSDDSLDIQVLLLPCTKNEPRLFLLLPFKILLDQLGATKAAKVKSPLDEQHETADGSRAVLDS